MRLPGQQFGGVTFAAAVALPVGGGTCGGATTEWPGQVRRAGLTQTLRRVVFRTALARLGSWAATLRLGALRGRRWHPCGPRTGGPDTSYLLARCFLWHLVSFLPSSLLFYSLSLLALGGFMSLLVVTVCNNCVCFLAFFIRIF